MSKDSAHQPTPGWWAVQHNIGNDRRLSLLPEDKVLAALGLLISATGWSIAFETPIVTEAELTRHAIVGAASTESVLETAALLVEAGIWTHIPGAGYDCGAGPHIEAKVERIEKARKAVEVRLAKRAQERAEARASLEDEGWTSK
jgi:hypothetical protein